MNFDFTEDQQEIKRTANEFLAARYPFDEVRRLAEDERGFTDEQWGEIVELGWPGLFAAEDDGGSGLGFVELLIVCEELGYALAPTPFLPHAAATLLAMGAGERELVRALASGDKLATAALQGGAAVPFAGSADLVVWADDEGVRVLDDFTATPVGALDPTRKLYEVTPGDGRALDVSPENVARVRDAVAAAYAAESVGAAQRAMEMAVEYAKDRKQFDRPIGAYQAVSHRCAQMLLEVEGARSVTYYAGWALDHEPGSAPLAVAVAKAYASDAGVRVPASSLQVHGGIGFTWEHDLHFFLKRGKANAHTLGDARTHRALVADLVVGEGAAAPA
jgi:alkylation response protein AidB-like acyl-CoA dehydrogenase